MSTASLLTIMGVVLVLVLFVVGMPRRGKQWRLRGLDEGNAARVGRLGEIKTVAATRLILSSSDYIDINDITITTRRATTTCGRWGSPLVTRTTRAGRHAEKQFLGCSRYPSCQYVRELK